MIRPEVKSLLTILRHSSDNDMIISKIKNVKKIIDNTEFKLIINGDKPIHLNSMTYNLVSSYNCWSLKSQIEYEIFVKNNTSLNSLYQYVKSI